MYKTPLPQWPSSKESTCNAGDAGDSSLIPGSKRSPGGRNGNPLQYSCLENPMDRGAWRVTVHGLQRVRHNLVTQPPITTHHHPVAQAHPTLCGPINCSTPDSFFHGISQARILKWVAISSSRESSWPKDITSVSFISYISGKFFTPKPLGKPL